MSGQDDDGVNIYFLNHQKDGIESISRLVLGFRLITTFYLPICSRARCPNSSDPAIWNYRLMKQWKKKQSLHDSTGYPSNSVQCAPAYLVLTLCFVSILYLMCSFSHMKRNKLPIYLIVTLHRGVVYILSILFSVFDGHCYHCIALDNWSCS